MAHGFYRATACNGTHGIAVEILSVRPSVRLSLRRVHRDKTKWRTANIFVLHETAITLVFWHQQWLVGNAPFPLKSALKVTHPPSKNADFDRFPLITSQPYRRKKSSITTNIKSTTGFPTSYRWSVNVTPKSRKGGSKSDFFVFFE